MKTIKRISTAVLSITLAVLMSLLTPVNCIAAENAQVYISEMKMGYGDEGKAALEAAGYSILKSSDSGEGVLGSSVWIGYKTTTNSKEAITDVSVMNMNGGYSVEKYREELKQLNQSVTEKLTEFKKAVAEFSAYYKNGSEYAKTAYDILSRLKEDDSGKNLAEIFTADTPDEDILHRVFMEGNTEIIDVVEGAVALGLTEVGEDTFIDRLAKTSYTDEVELKYNSERKIILDAFDVFKTVIATATSVYKTASEYKSADGTKSGVKAYLETLSGSDCRENAYYIYLYESAEKVMLTVDNDSYSIYQIATYNPDDDESEGVEMDAYIADMFRRAMTAGQIGVVGSAGLASLITSARSTKEKPAEGTTIPSSLYTINEYLKESHVTDLSVYTDVDRSLFSGDGDIAITDSAQREKALSGGSNFGKKTSDNKAYRIAMASLAGLSGAVAIGCGAAAIAMRATYNELTNLIVSDDAFHIVFASDIFNFKSPSEIASIKALQKALEIEHGSFGQTFTSSKAAQDFLDKIKNDKIYSVLSKSGMADNQHTAELFQNDYLPYAAVEPESAAGDTVKKCCFGDYSTKLNIGLTVVAAVAFIATVTFTILTILAYKNKPQTESIKYTAIPRVIIDKVSDSQNVASYYPYYAVKQITATDTEKDSLKLYGDLYGFNNTDEWFVLYTSKDSRLGSPLTPEALVKASEKELSVEQLTKYKAVHTFGNTGAIDLNNYKSGDKTKVFLYFKTAATTATAAQTGSLFNLENGIICLSSLLVGGLAAFAITYSVVKKKKVNA